MVTVLRPLSTSELLDRTFHLYRNSFAMFVGIATTPQLAVLTLRVGNAARMGARTPTEVIVTAWGIIFASFVAIEISHAATVTAVSSLHLDRPASMRSAYSSAKASLLRVVLISLVAVMVPVLIAVAPAILIGAALVGIGLSSGADNVTLIRVMSGVIVLAVLFIPLRWWLAWSLVVPVTVLEGGGLRASTRRSKSLSKGSRGRIFIVYALMIVLTWVVSAMLQVPFFLATGLHGLFAPQSAGLPARVMQALGAFISASLVGPLLTIALTLIYYDLRTRKEGFDLQLIMATLQQAQPVVAPPVIS